MGIVSKCWYCHWGWPKQVAEIYDKYVALAGETAMNYGPAHVVWDDENFDKDIIQSCIDEADKYSKNLSPEEKALVIESLKELLLVPDEILDPTPDYDGENPDKYPPPEGMVMVKR